MMFVVVPLKKGSHYVKVTAVNLVGAGSNKIELDEAAPLSRTCITYIIIEAATNAGENIDYRIP